MIKSKKAALITAILMTAVVALLVIVMIKPDIVTAISKKTSMPYAKVMDKTQVMSLEIIVDEASWASMLENATAEEYIMADVVINGVRIKNVGIRPKGNSSLSTIAQNPDTDRYSFKIEFDHYVKGQTWLGLDKLAVNNIQADSTYMKEYFSYDILNYIGVDTPLYAYADISVNGSNWGFYLAVECLEESYLTRNYSGAGVLYKPDSMGIRGDGMMNEFMDERNQEEVTQFVIPSEPSETSDMADEQPAEQGNRRWNREGGGFGGGGFGMSSGGVSLVYTDDDPASYYAIFENAKTDATTVDFMRVIKALKNLNTSTDLEKYVDVEATLRYFAGHNVVVNLDSYTGSMCHNYYLYENNGQISILPWDYNLAFGGFMSGSTSDVVNLPIDTPVSGVSLEDRPLLGKLLEEEEYMDMYHEYLREIVDGYFNSGLYESTVAYIDTLISSYVENDPSAFFTYEEYEKGVEALLELGKLRALSIEGQLDGNVPSTSDAQRANPELLIDASTVNLSDLGSMGFGGGGGGGFGAMESMDMSAIQKAMEILTSSEGEELTQEQLTQLEELGIDQEMIQQMQSMTNRMPMGNGNFGIPDQQMPNPWGGNRGAQPDMNTAPSTDIKAPAAQLISFNSQDNLSVGQGELNSSEMPTLGGRAAPNGGEGGMMFPSEMGAPPSQITPDSQRDMTRVPGDFNLEDIFQNGEVTPPEGMENMPIQMPFDAQGMPDGSQDFENFQPEANNFGETTDEETTVPDSMEVPAVPEEEAGAEQQDLSEQQFQSPWGMQPGQMDDFRGGMMPSNGNSQTNSKRQYNVALIVGSMVLLLGGLVFVATFKRRKLLVP